MVLGELSPVLVTGGRRGTFPTPPHQDWGQNTPRGPLGAQGGFQPPTTPSAPQHRG